MQVYAWMEERKDKIKAIGIACFGPVDLDPKSETYGYITTTPKEKWRHTAIVPVFQRLGKPVAFETDVNAPALSELKMNMPHLSSLCYVTVGTGVGVGAVVDHVTVHGHSHPEAG